jgi:hypothetical protein
VYSELVALYAGRHFGCGVWPDKEITFVMANTTADEWRDYLSAFGLKPTNKRDFFLTALIHWIFVEKGVTWLDNYMLCTEADRLKMLFAHWSILRGEGKMEGGDIPQGNELTFWIGKWQARLGEALEVFRVRGERSLAVKPMVWYRAWIPGLSTLLNYRTDLGEQRLCGSRENVSAFSQQDGLIASVRWWDAEVLNLWGREAEPDLVSGIIPTKHWSPSEDYPTVWSVSVRERLWWNANWGSFPTAGMKGERAPMLDGKHLRSCGWEGGLVKQGGSHEELGDQLTEGWADGQKLWYHVRTRTGQSRLEVRFPDNILPSYVRWWVDVDRKFGLNLEISESWVVAEITGEEILVPDDGIRNPTWEGVLGF